MKYEEVKKIVNEIIKTFVHRPWHIYSRISKHEIDIVCVNIEKVIKLTASTWQDNYYNELAERARLDIHVWGERRDHLYMSSQYVPGEEPDGTYVTIEKIVTSFNEINSYHERKQKLSMESPDISPGSPRAKLNNEFYKRDWTI